MTDVRAELKWWDALLALLGLLVVVGTTFVGLGMPVVNFLLIFYVPVALGTRIHGAIKKRIAFPFFKSRWLLAQAIARIAFVVVWIENLRLAVPYLVLGEEAARAIWWLLVPPMGIAVLASFLPTKRLLVARFFLVVAVTLFIGVQVVMVFIPPTDVVKMPSPLKGDVTVMQGGSSPIVNHHYAHRAQRHALDILVLRNGKVVDGDKNDRASYGCFGSSLYAPLKGTIAKVESNRPDMDLGKTDTEQIVGNHVVLQIAPERFVLFAHMKKGSATVREGDEVEAGHVIGQCGNSGNTSAPHLHLQVQSHVDFFAPDLRTFPIVFDGDSRPPRRNDRWTF